MSLVDVIEEITLEEAEQVLREAQDAFIQRDVPRILQGFAPDVVIRYADFPDMKGLGELGAWLEARFKRQKNYRLKKTLRAVTGDTIAAWFEGRWEDAVTGKQMQNRGCEFLTMRDGKIARWDCTANAWEVGGSPTTPIV
jgi:nuclear transport factor 2 (NTF2) superfamily protein